MASVGVERRVAHELVIHREVSGLPDRKIVIEFQDLLGAVGQVAVAVEDARAARLQEFYLLGRSTAQNTRKTDGVIGPIPFRAFDARPQRNRPVGIGVRPCRFMAVILPHAGKHADVLRKLLFPVQPEAVLVAVAERGGRDG